MAMGAVGILRRVVASLVVLAMLTLVVGPALAVPTLAAPAPDHGHHHEAQDCEPAAGGPAALPPSPADPATGHHGSLPGLACCIALQCPMLLGGLPMPPPQLLPHGGVIVPREAMVSRPFGIEVPPALRPPRAA